MKEIKKAKSGTDATFGFVALPDFTSNQFLEDLAKLYKLKDVLNINLIC